MTAHESTTVAIPTYVHRAILVGPAIIGAALGLVVRPFVDWIVDVTGGAPGVLRLLAGIPVFWSVLALVVIGAIAGLLLSEGAKEDSLRVTVADDHVELAMKKENRRIARDGIHGVLREGHDLLLVDADEGTLARYSAKDLDAAALEAAFTRHGYPWRGEDAGSDEFVRWVEGDRALPDDTHRLLSQRSRALADGRSGDAANLADELREQGVIVRDRAGVQYYRRR